MIIKPEKGLKMDEQNKTGVRSKISRWENNFVERHPVSYAIVAEFIAELLIASVLALFAFHMLPPDLSATVSQTSTQSSILSISNDGFLFAKGEYSIKSADSIKAEPVIKSGKKYVDSLERASDNAFNLEVSGLPYRKEIKIEFGTGDITVNEQ